MHLQMLSRQGELAATGVNAGVHHNHVTIVGVSVFTIFLAVISVGLRFFCRRRLKMGWKLDDWAITIAAIFTVVDAALWMFAIRYGFGKHIALVLENPHNLKKFFQITYAAVLLYVFAISFVKISVLAFYNRMFGRRFHHHIVILGSISILWSIIFTFVSVFQCSPVRRAWNMQLEGTCIPYLNIFIGLQVVNIVLDVVILCVPITAVMGLHMANSKKRSVIGIFLLGGLSIVFAIIRLAILVQDKKRVDLTFATPRASWSLVEPAFEIFCACIPTLAPLLKVGKCFTNIRSTFLGNSWSGNSSHACNSAIGASRARMEKSHKVTISIESFIHKNDTPAEENEIPLDEIRI